MQHDFESTTPTPFPTAESRPARTLIPRGDRVLVKRDEETVSQGGIHLPDSRKEKPCTGTIVEVGPGTTTLRKGASIMFGQWSGIEVTLDNVTYIILKEEEIVAVIVPVPCGECSDCNCK
jgi:chaperonin GroES